MYCSQRERRWSDPFGLVVLVVLVVLVMRALGGTITVAAAVA
jgi:hypothetical protein